MSIPQRSLCWLLCKALLPMVISIDPSSTNVVPLKLCMSACITDPWVTYSKQLTGHELCMVCAGKWLVGSGDGRPHWGGGTVAAGGGGGGGGGLDKGGGLYSC